MAQANIDEPSEIAPRQSDRETARLHGVHIACITSQFVCGQSTMPFENEAPFEGDDTQKPLGLTELF